jgi:uncharacterized membrane protein YphA (DoxX/SURF4 family)
VNEGVEAITLSFRFGLAVVFLTASVPKLLARADFVRAVRNYRLLPERLSEPVATWLPRIELGLGLLLLMGVATTAASALAATAFVLFAAAVAINLVRGRRIECGCYSPVAPRTIGWGLVFRDLLLASLAIVVVIAPPQALAIEALWGDHTSSIRAEEGIALALVAATLVLAHLLVDEAVRVRRAIRSLAPSSETSQ